jgi:hypothetical protein
VAVTSDVKTLRTVAILAFLAVTAFLSWYVVATPILQARARRVYVEADAPEGPQFFQAIGALDPIVRETSGLAVSRRSPGTLWTHNDSGDGPRVYAVDDAARLQATFEIAGAAARDWEDMDLGPCAHDPGKSCLYVGDIGDNGRSRQVLTVYLAEEPDPSDSGGSIGLEGRLRYTYPDAPHDAEALAVSPAGDLVIVTKGRTPAILLHLIHASDVREAMAADSVITMPAGRELPIQPDWMLGRVVTGASFSPDGATLAVRTYTEIFFLPWPWAGAADGTPPSCFLGDRNLGGEAVAYEDSMTLLLTEEAGLRRPASLARVRCAASPDATIR